MAKEVVFFNTLFSTDFWHLAPLHSQTLGKPWPRPLCWFWNLLPGHAWARLTVNLRAAPQQARFLDPSLVSCCPVFSFTDIPKSSLRFS